MGKINDWHPSWKERGKLSLITDSMILYIENCKDTTNKIETIKKVDYKIKFQDTRLIYRNLLYFFTLIIKYWRKQKKIPFKIASRNKILKE